MKKIRVVNIGLNRVFFSNNLFIPRRMTFTLTRFEIDETLKYFSGSQSSYQPKDVQRHLDFLERYLSSPNFPSQKYLSRLIPAISKDLINIDQRIRLSSLLVLGLNKNTDLLTFTLFSNGIYNLRKLNQQLSEVQSFYRCLIDKMKLSQQSRQQKETLQPHLVAKCLYGVSYLTSYNSTLSSEVLKLTLLVLGQSQIKEPLSAQQTAMSLTVFKSLSIDDPVLSELIHAITPLIRSCSEPFSSQAVSMSLGALRGLTSEREEVRHLIQTLIPLIQTCPGPLSDQQVSMSLQGLRGMSSESQEVRGLIRVLLPLIRSCQSTGKRLSNQGVSMSISGLKGMSSSDEGVIELLRALIPLIPTRPATSSSSPSSSTASSPSFPSRMSSQEVAMCLGGLKGLSSDILEVRQLLRVLLPLIRTCSGPFSSQMIAMCISGLKGMTLEAREVTELVNYITTTVLSSYQQQQGQQPKGDEQQQQQHEGGKGGGGKFPPVSSQEVAMSLSGLKGMTSKSPEALRLVQCLIPYVQSCGDIYSSQEISMCLSGLKGMDSEKNEVRELLSSILPCLDCIQGVFTAQNVAMCLSGMKEMKSEHIEVEELVRKLFPRLILCRDKKSFTSQEVAMCLNGLKGFKIHPSSGSNPNNNDNHQSEVLDFLQWMIQNIRYLQSPFTCQEVAMCLNGLKNMNSEISEVRTVIRSLSLLVRDTRGMFTSQEVAMSLGGMRGMSSSVKEVRELLRAILPLINSETEFIDHSNSLPVQTEGERQQGIIQKEFHWTPFSLSVLEISMALNGLKSMKSECPEVQQLLAQLIPRIQPCAWGFSSSEVARAMIGMRGMDNQDEIVRRLIRSLIPLIQNRSTSIPDELLSDLEVMMCFVGLKSMTSEHQEVVELLTALWTRIRSRPHPLSPAFQTTCYHGMRGMNSDIPIVKEILSFISSSSSSISTSTYTPPSSSSTCSLNIIDDYYLEIDEYLNQPDSKL